MKSILSNQHNFYPLEVVGRLSKTQFQIDQKELIENERMEL